MIGLEHGLLMGLFGIMFTIAGFMAAYIIAFKYKENEEKRKQKKINQRFIITKFKEIL